jgi:hypothetical protein
MTIKEWLSDDYARIDHIYRTLQHMLAGDEIWMSRLHGNDPTLTGLPKIRLQNLDNFSYQRISLDECIEKAILAFYTLDLLKPICYRDGEGHL